MQDVINKDDTKIRTYMKSVAKYQDEEYCCVCKKHINDCEHFSRDQPYDYIYELKEVQIIFKKIKRF